MTRSGKKDSLFAGVIESKIVKLLLRGQVSDLQQGRGTRLLENNDIRISSTFHSNRNK
jgi:hypothetical protein